MGFDDVRKEAAAARDDAARYLREAIVNLSGVDPTSATTLLSPPFDVPFQASRLEKYLRGSLIGKTDELAAEGQQYPYMIWRSTLTKCARDDDGKYKFSVDDNLTASLGPGVSFKPESHEVWGPRMK